MKHAKQSKLLAMLLAVIMVLTMLPAVVLATESASGSCGASLSWQFDNGTLTISGAGRMADFTTSPDLQPWKDLRSQITSVVISNGVTYLGNRAFQNCSAITSVTLPQSLTELGTHVFKGCSKITSLDLTHIQSMGKEALVNCSGLTTITMPARLNEIPQAAFSGLSAMTSSIKIPDGVTSIGPSAFVNWGSNAGQKVNIEWNDDVTTIGSSAFQGANIKDSLTIPASVTILDTKAFWKTGITSLTFVGNKLQTIGELAFSGCKNLTGLITLPASVQTIGKSAFMETGITGLGFENGSSLRTIGESAFAKTELLNSAITLPDSVTSIGKSAFSESGITGLNISEASQLNTIDESAFFKCASLSGNIYIPSSVKNISNLAFPNTQITSVILDEGVTVIGDYVFSDAKSLHTVLFPSTLTTIGEKAFYGVPNTCIIYFNSSIPGGLTEKILACTNGGTFAENTVFEAGKLAAPIKKGYIFDGWYTKDGANNDWGDKITAAPTVGKTYYAKWAEKTLPSISFKNGLKLDKTYDGQAVSLSSDDYIVTAGAGNVTFAYQAKDGGGWKDIDTAPKNAGIYQVKAIAVESDTHKRAETGWKEFAISKAAPTYTAPTGLTAAVGQTLADVTLPEGFAWQDAAASVGDAGIKTFKATFTPKDTVNYHTVTIDLSLTVQPNPATKPPKTGDTSHSLLWTALLLVSGGTVLALLLKRKRQNI